MNPLRPVILGLILAVSCAAPDHNPPELPFPLPDRWTGAPAPDGSSTPGPWWRSFKDDRINDLIENSCRNHPSLKAAIARVDSALGRANLAGSDMLPFAGAGLSGSRRVQNIIGLPIPGEDVLTTRSTTYALSFDLSWEIDLWGRVRSARSAAEAEVEASRADVAGIWLSLVGQLCRQAFSVLEANHQLALAERKLEIAVDLLDIVRSRYEKGLAPSADLAFSRAEVARAELAARQWEGIRDGALRSLETLAGKYPSASLDLNGPLPALPGPVPAGLPSELVSRRPDLFAAERRLAAAVARQDEAVATLYPRLSLSGSTGTSSNQLSDLLDGDFSVWSILGNIVQPIFQGGRLIAGLKLSDAAAEETLNVFLERALTAFREVESALAADPLLARREKAILDLLEEARTIHRLADERWRCGLGPLSARLETERAVLNAESTLLALRRHRLDNRVNLHLALGGDFNIDSIRPSPDEEETQ